MTVTVTVTVTFTFTVTVTAIVTVTATVSVTVQDTGVIYGMTSACAAVVGSAGTYLTGVVLDTTDSWAFVFQVGGGGGDSYFCFFVYHHNGLLLRHDLIIDVVLVPQNNLSQRERHRLV